MSRESSASARSKNQILKPDFLRRKTRLTMVQSFCLVLPNQCEKLSESVARGACVTFFFDRCDRRLIEK
jgi:hypothetical protein